MKKVFLLIFTLSLLLSGCGCSHEWMDADCLAPRSCALCGETEGEALGHHWADAACETPKACSLCGMTEGEALGHSWAEATCAAPKICTLCGAQQGEPSSHSFGKLKRSGDTMFRSCELCGLEEAPVPFDRESFLQDNLLGRWSLHSTLETNEEGDYRREIIADSLEPDILTIKEDGTFAGELVLYYTGTWAYRETTENNGSFTYWFDLHIDGEREDKLHSLSYNEESGVSFVLDQNTLISTYYFQRLSPELKAAEAHVLGTWNSTQFTTYQVNPETYIYEEDTVSFDLSHSFTFFEDGTLSAPLLSDKNGTWFCTYAEESIYTYQLQFDGEDRVYNCIYSPWYGLELNLDTEGTLVSYTFFQMTQEELAEFVKGPELLTGNWVSDSDNAYSITVNADGTFQGILPTEVSGTWSYDNYDLETRCYTYTFEFDQDSDYGKIFTLQPDGIFYAWRNTEDGSMEFLLEKQ